MSKNEKGPTQLFSSKMIADSSDNQGTNIPHQQNFRDIKGNGNVVNYNMSCENSSSDTTDEFDEEARTKKNKKKIDKEKKERKKKKKKRKKV